MPRLKQIVTENSIKIDYLADNASPIIWNTVYFQYKIGEASRHLDAIIEKYRSGGRAATYQMEQLWNITAFKDIDPRILLWLKSGDCHQQR